MDIVEEFEEEAEPVVLFEWEYDEDKYRIMGPIGAAGGATVYKAEISEMNWKFMMRYVKVSDKEVFEDLKCQVAANTYDCADGILGVVRAFYYKGYYCVTSRYMNHGSRLTPHPNGPAIPARSPPILHHLLLVPNASLSLSLSSTALVISAAHIFLRGASHVAAFLGYASTVHDLLADQDYNTSCYMPATSVCAWAAAPEVVYDGDSKYGVKADVWLIGITALELAYGGLKLRSRDDLDSLLRNVHPKKDLPKKLNPTASWKKDKKLMIPSCLNPLKKIAPTGFEGEAIL